MKVQYIGTKKKLTLGRPFGHENKRTKNKMDFTAGGIYDLNSDEAETLVSFGCFVYVEDEKEEDIEEKATKKRGRPRKVDDDSLDS